MEAAVVVVIVTAAHTLLLMKTIPKTKKTAKQRKSQKKHSLDGVQLAKVYYDPSNPAGYAGAIRLSKSTPQASSSSIKKWLSTQPAYSLHKPMKRRFPTRKYKVAGPNELWQMDLMEMIPYASVNKGHRYILTCIDVFTRVARVEPLKSKDGPTVAKAITTMLKQSNVIPRHVQTDLGKEFYNSSVKEVLTQYGIHHYSIYSEYKAAVVERFNRTLRERLNRFFTRNGNKVWIDSLAHIINAYNQSTHRGLGGKRPIDIDESHWEYQENSNKILLQKRPKPFPVNSYVRISRLSASPFRKNFDQNWSEEVFQIVGIDTRDRPTMYVIKDLNDNLLQGKFYRQELQVIDKPPDVYRIEKIIRTRGTGKHKQYLVKWHGYDNSHNSWISADKFVDKF